MHNYELVADTVRLIVKPRSRKVVHIPKDEKMFEDHSAVESRKKNFTTTPTSAEVIHSQCCYFVVVIVGVSAR